MINKTASEYFLERLREYMTEMGLSQNSLSLNTGIPRSTIKGWFNGIQNPGLEYLVILARFFKCSVDYLLGLEDEFGNKTC